MRTLRSPQASREGAETIFNRVLVGIDGSAESLDAARQAALLENAGGSLTLLAAWNLEPPAMTPGLTPPVIGADEETARRHAIEALRVAKELAPEADTVVEHRFAAHALLDGIERQHATLVAIGSHGQGRAAGIVAGATATSLVHRAPCSVLVTRKQGDGVPERIVVGVDGSAASAAAYDAARYLAERFGSELTVVVAEGAKPVDLAGVSLIAGDRYHVIPEDPVPVLAAASADADLLVVGSRGLHGLKAVGSVSERVAHQALCSTLIVRTG